jgi:hypothetical protein
VYDVKKPNATLQENFQMFVESDFSYLYNSLYISNEQKLLNMRIAEGDKLIEPQSDDDRKPAILAQQSLSQKDKMASYG